MTRPSPRPVQLVDRERAAIEARIAALTTAFTDIVESAKSTNIDDEHDPEGATLAFERAQVSSLLEQAHRRLDALDAAAARVADGTFGFCTACGRQISADRLAALPATDHCIICAGQHRRG